MGALGDVPNRVRMDRPAAAFYSYLRGGDLCLTYGEQFSNYLSSAGPIPACRGADLAIRLHLLRHS